MRRRDKTGGKEGKTQRRQTVRRRNTAKVAHRRKRPAANVAERIALLTRERDEALERQTATSEVLTVIGSSPGELEPVFNAILENATRICEAKFGTLYRYDGGVFYPVTFHKVPSSFADFLRKRGSFVPPSGTPLDRLLRTKEVIRTADDSAAEIPSPSARLAGAKSHIVVPMFKNDELAGAIVIYRQEVRPFTDKQIELVQNFADQAVIAIENTRLINETKEALEQQRASAEVLNVISNSVSDAEPVFEKIVESCERIFATSRIGLNLIGPDGLVHAGAYGKFPGAEKLRRENFPHPVPGSATEAAISAGRPIQYPDALSDSDVPQYGRRAAKIVGFRAFVIAPLLSEGRGLGAIFVGRETIGSFSDKEIALLKTFAAQAVIAIENTRLLNELRKRTDDLSEALDQQTATSEVLKVISSSPSDLRPVFQSMLENSVRICEAKFGQMFLCEGDKVRAVAQLDVPAALVQWDEQRGAFQPSAEGGLMRAMRTKKVIHIDDFLSEQPSNPVVKLGGARSYIAVPMLKERELVGVIVIYRQEVRPFTEKQIDLVQNFATQAVIAIENARLLNDLNKLNQQLEQRVAEQVSEIERMGKLRRFLPPQVADLIVASGAEKQLESHRREITALFCDLRGFTGFSESSDPEDVMALLREYHAAIGEIINKYGGTLERYAGDGVMVVFNDPIPVENPALQAVLMAIDMRSAIGTLIEKWRRLGHEIGFGIGVAHGFATLGTIGFEGRFDYAAIGTVSNVASRLCDEAKPGQILISPRVLMAVEGAISVEPVGEFKLKGISRPLATYNVLSAGLAKI